MEKEYHPVQAKKKYAKLIILIAAPILIFALGVLFYQVYLRKALTTYVENLLEEKIATHLNLSPGDLLDINVQKLKFNAFSITVLTPDISICAATQVHNEDYSAMPCYYVYETGVMNLEISLKPIVLVALGQRKFNINRFQADSIYFSKNCISTDPRVVISSRQQIESGPIHFKGRVKMNDYENNVIENLSFEKHSFQAANLSVYLPETLYSFHINSIVVDGTMETISIEKVKMLPIHTREEFNRHVDFQTDRIETHLDYIKITGFQIHKKHDKRGLIISRVDIRKGVTDVFRDRRPPFNEDQRPAMPVRLILSAPVDIFIAEITISEADILYWEFPEEGSLSGFHEAAGHVPFNSLEATVSNITNMDDALYKDSFMHITAQAYIFDEAILRAAFRYNLKDINGGYSAEAELSQLRFESINPAIYPLAGIKITEGVHQSSVFSFSGNDIESSGELYMKWRDLSVNITPESGAVITGITQSLGKLTYRQSNPNDGNTTPSGDIYYERDISRFVFHYWWNCYLSGIKHSVLHDFVPL